MGVRQSRTDDDSNTSIEQDESPGVNVMLSHELMTTLEERQRTYTASWNQDRDPETPSYASHQGGYQIQAENSRAALRQQV